MKGRQRGRNGGKPRPHQQGGHRNNNYDPNMGRMRGNAQQLMDKFLALARDASSQGDRVMAENYYQHADHYYRVLNARFEGQQSNNNNNNNQRRFNGQPSYDRPDRPFEGPDAQSGGFDDYNRAEPPPSMPAPQPMIAVTQPVPPLVQSQPLVQPEPESDIGLPPQLFGAADSMAAPSDVDAAAPANDETSASPETRSERPRQAVRRRRAPRASQ